MVLVGTLNGKRPLRIPRHIWEENFKINLEETDGMVDRIYLAQKRDKQ